MRKLILWLAKVFDVSLTKEVIKIVPTYVSQVHNGDLLITGDLTVNGNLFVTGEITSYGTRKY